MQITGCALCLLHGVAIAECGQDSAPLLLYFNERPPYMATGADGGVHGLVADVANQTLTRAGIHFRWTALPTNRHLLMLQHSEECGCAVGWFQLAERQQFAQFSRPLYRDSDAVAVVRVEFIEPVDRRFSRWLQQPRLRVLIKQRYSYGDYLDQLLATSHAQRLSTTGETKEMLQQVMRNQADVVLLSAAEANWQIANLQATQKLRVVYFNDAPPTRTRHLMCNYAVPPALMQKIDAELPEKL